MKPEEIQLLATVIVAASAVTSGVTTVLLLFEARATRNLRRDANMYAYPGLYSEGGMIICLRVENPGPAVARDVEFTYRLHNHAGNRDRSRTQRQPVLAPNRRLTVLPGSALAPEPHLSLNDLAEAGFVLTVSWSWRDHRRRFFVLPIRHTRNGTWLATELRDGLYGGWTLHERTMEEAVDRLGDEAEELRKVMETISRREAERESRRSYRGWRDRNLRLIRHDPYDRVNWQRRNDPRPTPPRPPAAAPENE